VQRMTPLFKRLGFLLVLAGIWLAPAKATPYVVQACGQTNDHGAVYNIVDCHLNNTTSGNTIIASIYTNGTPSITIATEAFTCPAGAKATDGTYFSWQCYVVTASNHGDFHIQVQPSSFGYSLVLEEVQGLGALDSGSAAAANATSINFTTAANNEWVHASCVGYAAQLAPTSPFTPIAEATVAQNPGYWQQTQKNIEATAGSYTASCTYTTLNCCEFASTLAFAQSGSPPTPAINYVQWCFTSDADPTQGCYLHNVTSGNKVVFATTINSPPSSTVGSGCLGNGVSVTCVCPSSSQASAAYSTPQGTATMVTAACYYDLGASYSTFFPAGGCTSCSAHSVVAAEINGLSTGVDASSEASAFATTVNYSTTINNEWSFCAATEIVSSIANGMVGGNSFLPSGTTLYNVSTRGTGLIQTTSWGKSQPSSGAHTCSYTQTGSTNPQLVTFSVGYIVPQTSSNHSTIF
jgi:hypothetical protein